MNAQEIDKIIYELDKELIIARKKIPVLPLIITIIGVLCIVLTLGAKPSESGKVVINALGYLIAIPGLIFFIANYIRKQYPYYVPTGEMLKRSELSFENTERSNVVKHVTEGNYHQLHNLSKQGTSIVAISYKTKSEDVLITQAFEYVPHSYQPITNVHFFKNKELVG